MIVKELHPWQLSIKEAMALQSGLAPQVSTSPCEEHFRYIAGVDVRAPVVAKGEGAAAVVVLTYPELEIIEASVEYGQIEFPYVPGLLSFREMPLIIRAFKKLVTVPDLIIVDGQGMAHPRRFGIASHLGLILDIPTIGCAKSRLIGSYDEPGNETGDYSYIRDEDEITGAVVRTRKDVKPVYVSIGHKISLEQSIRWTLKCSRDYRLPEPTRMAHTQANQNRTRQLIQAGRK